MKEMYYGTTWKWPIEHLPKVMLSANVVANMKSIWQMPDKWMMDSGIGGLFANGKRPVSIEKYMEIIEKWNPPIAWSYDWPCEPSVRENTKMTVKQSQDNLGINIPGSGEQ